MTAAPKVGGRKRAQGRPTPDIDWPSVLLRDTVEAVGLQGPPMGWILRPTGRAGSVNGITVRTGEGNLRAWLRRGLHPEVIRAFLEPDARPAFDALVAELLHRFEVVMAEYARLKMAEVVDDAIVRRTQRAGRAGGAKRSRAALSQAAVRADARLLESYLGIQRREELSDRAIARRPGWSRRKVARARKLARAGTRAGPLA